MLFKEKSVLIDNEPTPRKERLSGLIKIAAAIAILVLGLFATLAIFRSSPKATPVIKQQLTPRVQTVTVQSANLQIPLHLQGLTEAADIRAINANLNGTIVSISDKLRENQTINKGEWLLKVDNSQAQLEISQARANIDTAKSHYNTVKATIDINARALRELGVTPPTNPPQLAEAKMRINTAQQQFNIIQEQAAKVNMYAPFSARILKSMVSTTDLVAQGRPIAQTISSDKLIAKLPIADKDLDLLDQNSFTQGNKLAVTVSNNNETMQWTAAIVGLETGNNLNGQFNYLITEIYHPFKSQEKSLAIASTVKSTLLSRPLNNIFKLPLSLIRNGSEVWTLDAQQRLSIQNVKIIYQDAKHAFITEGLKNNSAVISSTISFPVDGMQLRKK